MSLITSLFTNGSGLQANQKWAEATSRNIANANTPGYHRKEVSLESRLGVLGGGVFVSSVDRAVDESLTRSYRYENSKMSMHSSIAKSLDEYVALLGQPNDENNISSNLSEFKTSLNRLMNSPDSAATQRTVVMAADNFTRSLRQTSDNLTKAETELDMALNHNIDSVNKQLNRLSEINRDIHRSASLKADSLELLDERDRIIDSLSESMNIRVMERDDGRATVYTGGGTTLVEGETAYNISYNSTTQSLSAGGIDITPDPQNPGGFEYGSLAGHLHVKNEVIPTFNKQLDELARGVIEAFEGADSSLAPGQAGLFTDDGNPLNPANVDDLAKRISVNDAIRPEKGGSLWRVREGIGATTQQGSSYVGQVEEFLDIFDTTFSYDNKTGLEDMTLENFSSNVVSYQGTLKAEADKSFESVSIAAETIYNARISHSGVNIDDELQKMMLIEQTYAANAQAIQATTTMLDNLIAIA